VDDAQFIIQTLTYLWGDLRVAPSHTCFALAAQVLLRSEPLGHWELGQVIAFEGQVHLASLRDVERVLQRFRDVGE